MQLFPSKKPSIPVSRDLKILLIIGGLYALSTFISNTFVNVFLWKQSGDYMDIATYNLFIYLLQPISFFVAGKCVKHVDRTLIIRIGVIFLSIFYMVVLLLGEKAVNYTYMLGAILGIGYGFYWLAYNVLTFEVTEPETRDLFNGILGSLQSFGGMVGPLLAGYIITLMDNFKGYSTIFFLSFFLFFLAIVCSFYLKKRTATGRFFIREVFKERKHNTNWRSVLFAHLTQGSREGLFIFIITIWVYIETNSELSLGLFNFLISLCSFISYYFVSKMVSSKKRKAAIFYGGLALYLAVLLFVFPTSYVTILLYGVIIGVSFPLFNVPFVSLTYDIIGKSKNAGNWRVEYIIIREVFINIGRVLAIIVFIVSVSFLDPIFIIPVLMLVFGGGNFLSYFFIRKTSI